MKYLVITGLFLLVGLNLHAQSDSLNFAYDVPPSFESGIDGLYQLFRDSIVYPDSAKDAAIEGVVVLCFNIDTSGNLHFKQFVSEFIGYGLENEALRVLMLTEGMWTPALKNGQYVRGSLSLPVAFKLN